MTATEKRLRAKIRRLQRQLAALAESALVWEAKAKAHERLLIHKDAIHVRRS